MITLLSLVREKVVLGRPSEFQNVFGIVIIRQSQQLRRVSIPASDK